jgi:tetraacyldisaccharide-1-P 4'-kinase
MRVAAGVDYIVTTEKDGVKLTPLLKKGLNLWALRVEAQVREKKEWLAYLMGGV